MLTWLGVGTIAVLLVLILFRITSVLVALTLVPLAAALVGGFGREIGAFAVEGIRSVVPVASLFTFAVLYFGVMNDAGLFEPVIRNVVRVVGVDPVKVAVGTAAIAAICHLDGAGASTFMITVPAMLPIYTRLRMDPLALTCTTAVPATAALAVMGVRGATAVQAVTAVRAAAEGTSSAGLTISTTSAHGSRPCAPRQVPGRSCCWPTRTVA